MNFRSSAETLDHLTRLVRRWEVDGITQPELHRLAAVIGVDLVVGPITVRCSICGDEFARIQRAA